MLETQVNCRIVELGKVVAEILSCSISGHFCISSLGVILCVGDTGNKFLTIQMLACSMCS